MREHVHKLVLSAHTRCIHALTLLASEAGIDFSDRTFLLNFSIDQHEWEAIFSEVPEPMITASNKHGSFGSTDITNATAACTRWVFCSLGY